MKKEVSQNEFRKSASSKIWFSIILQVIRSAGTSKACKNPSVGTKVPLGAAPKINISIRLRLS